MAALPEGWILLSTAAGDALMTYFQVGGRPRIQVA